MHMYLFIVVVPGIFYACSFIFWKMSKLLPSTIAKVWITPKLLFGLFYPPNYTLWFKLPPNIIYLFHFCMYRWSFKLKFYKMIVHIITHIRKIYHNFYRYCDMLEYLTKIKYQSSKLYEK